MPADDGWTTVTAARPVSAASASRSGRPQLTLVDIILMLWRAKWIVLLVALPIFVASVLFALTLSKQYQATSRIQVTAGEERVFDPLVGDVTASVLSQEEITESEIELLHSPVIADRVIQKLGLEVIYPKMAEAYNKAPAADKPLIYEQAVQAVQKNFYAGAAPKNPVIRTGFKNENPIVAADVLNTMIETYIEYRSEIFLGDDKGVLTTQREASNEKLLAADQAIERFLTENRIGDFDTEKTTTAAQYASITDEMFKVQAQKSEVDKRLSALISQLALTEPTIDLSVETNFQQQLFDLKLEREGLLSKYQPSTPQVQQLDRRINQMQELIDQQGNGAGVIRRGPNEVYQSMDARRAELVADSSALEGRFEELQRQKRQIEERQLQLTRLEPKYQDLLRNRAILESQVRSISIREQEERLKREIAKADTENIQILEPARPPAKGESSRKLVAAAGLLFGGFTGLMFALIWVFTRPTLATASCVTRTTGLPVLASVRA
ncbi:GumC family protein [Ponticaulis profundi]|uniref:GumC family protein n=1 Tax=Ponticaulis profundi TaxID=2665222 RepID=A0ABW1S842_9PROT